MEKGEKLYIVTDSKILKASTFYDSIEETLKAGVQTIQLREKNLEGKLFLERAKKLREITTKYNAKLIINDRIDIALLCDADGVHIGQNDIPTKEAKKLIGDKILGVSVSNVLEAKEAKTNGANYIGVGAMFKTNTKLDANYVTLDILDKIINEVDIKIVCIGGINLDNISKLKRDEIQSYAVISAILASDNIYNETKKWLGKM